MNVERFLIAIAKAIRDDEIWILVARGIVVDCSDSFLDYTELTRCEVIGRDIYENPLHDTPMGDKMKKILDPYKLIFNGSISDTLKIAVIQPNQYKDYRFSLTVPQKNPIFLTKLHEESYYRTF